MSMTNGTNGNWLADRGATHLQQIRQFRNCTGFLDRRGFVQPQYLAAEPHSAQNTHQQSHDRSYRTARAKYN